jgi:hypothetical protein
MKFFVKTPRYACCQQKNYKKNLSAKANKQLRAVLHSVESIFVIEYIRGYEAIVKTASACEPEDPGVFFAKKTRVENLVTVSL